MRFDVLTLFPEIFSGYLTQSLLKLAIQNGLVDIKLWNIRDWATGVHKSVDDRPFGGGPGMVLMPGPVFDAVEAVRKDAVEAGELILLTPAGERLTQRIVAPELAFRAVRGLPPDIMVFFDDLGYRALGSVGHGSVYSSTNDTGPDACNHDWQGVFMLAGPQVSARGPQSDLSIYDVAQTILGVFGLQDPRLLGRDRSQN